VIEHTVNPRKTTALGIALVVAAAVIAALLVAGWGSRAGLDALLSSMMSPAPAEAPVKMAPAQMVAQSPSPADVEACNQYAKAQAGDKTIEVVKEGAAAEAGRGPGKGVVNGGMVSAATGTLHGINERKKNDARYVEAYRACMKGRGFSS
jgi:hypothetical protein